MIEYLDECVGCPPEMGCLGDACPNRNVLHLTCDKCGSECNVLYWNDDKQWCRDCILQEYNEVIIY